MNFFNKPKEDIVVRTLEDEDKPKVIAQKISIAMIPSIMLILILAWIRLSYTVTGSSKAVSNVNYVDTLCKENSNTLNIDATVEMQSITFEKGKVTEWSSKNGVQEAKGKSIVCLRRVTDEISQRGIMVKNKADELSIKSEGNKITLSTETSWSKLNGTIGSIPYAAPKEFEQWFTT